MCFTSGRRNQSDACSRGWNRLRRSSRRRQQKSKRSNLVRDDCAHLTPTLLIPYWLEKKYPDWCLMLAFVTKPLEISSGGCSRKAWLLRCPQTSTLPLLWCDLTRWAAPTPAESSLQSRSEQDLARTVDGLAWAGVSNLNPSWFCTEGRREMPKKALIFMKASAKVPFTSLIAWKDPVNVFVICVRIHSWFLYPSSKACVWRHRSEMMALVSWCFEQQFQNNKGDWSRLVSQDPVWILCVRGLTAWNIRTEESDMSEFQQKPNHSDTFLSWHV